MGVLALIGFLSAGVIGFYQFFFITHPRIYNIKKKNKPIQFIT